MPISTNPVLFIFILVFLINTFLINISTYSTMVYLNLISRLVVIRIFTKYFITNLSTITKKILLFLYIKLIFNRNDCIKQICAHYFIVDFVSELCTWEIRFTLYKYLIIQKKCRKHIFKQYVFIVPFQNKIEIKHENTIEYKPYHRDFSSISIHTQRYGGNSNKILDIICTCTALERLQNIFL